MKIKHSFCLLLLTMVIVVASEALAGGWVLWVKDEQFGNPKGGQWQFHKDSNWGIIDGFPTEMECRQRIKERIDRATNPDNWTTSDSTVFYKVTENIITFLFFDKDAKPNETGRMRGTQIIHHACLPDSLDPREPSQLVGFDNYNKQVPLPDFSVTVTLSDRARAKFQESKETIIVLAYFADKIGPEEKLSLGKAEFELQQPGTVSIKNVILFKENVEALRNPDYEVLINVFSGRRSSDKNLLSCKPSHLQGPISTFQKKSFSITCDLGRWVK